MGHDDVVCAAQNTAVGYTYSRQEQCSSGQALEMTFPLEWALKQKVADRIFQVLETPQVDLFATSKNTRLPQF